MAPHRTKVRQNHVSKPPLSPGNSLAVKILLTGGAGYIGSACLRRLLRHGHDPIAYDNMLEGNAASVPDGRLVKGDILDTDKLCEAALAYAAAGVPVLPCRPGRKQPLILDWPSRASTDRDQLIRWWRRWPTANIGLRTGTPGFDVLDVDVREDGSGLELQFRSRFTSR